MAQGQCNHSAARPETGRIVGCRRKRPAVAEGQKRGGAAAMTVIEARGLRKAFGTTIALDGVNLHVEEGRILGLIGPDVAVLPRWIGVSQALDYVAGVHPRFDRAKAEGLLAKTAIRAASKVRELSKGMVTQLHLALVMAIDAKLLVLDEPTLGLDI